MHYSSCLVSVACMGLFVFISSLWLYFWYHATTTMTSLIRTLSSKKFLAIVKATVVNSYVTGSGEHSGRAPHSLQLWLRKIQIIRNRVEAHWGISMQKSQGLRPVKASQEKTCCLWIGALFCVMYEIRMDGKQDICSKRRSYGWPLEYLNFPVGFNLVKFRIYIHL